MGKKVYIPRDITMQICFGTMSAHDFTTLRRREWTIWAAKASPCSDCEVKPYQACVSLADLRNRDPQKKLSPSVNKWPHDSRIDWDRMLQGLKQRGYYHPSVEAQIRKRNDVP